LKGNVTQKEELLQTQSDVKKTPNFQEIIKYKRMIDELNSNKDLQTELELLKQ
jgi:hypothetical protein